MNIRTVQHLRLASRARRHELGFTQQEAALRARVSRKWISEFEGGKGGADVELVLRLLAALELDLDVVPAGRRHRPSSSAGVDLGAVLARYARGTDPA